MDLAPHVDLAPKTDAYVSNSAAFSSAPEPQPEPVGADFSSGQLYYEEAVGPALPPPGDAAEDMLAEVLRGLTA